MDGAIRESLSKCLPFLLPFICFAFSASESKVEHTEVKDNSVGMQLLTKIMVYYLSPFLSLISP